MKASENLQRERDFGVAAPLVDYSGEIDFIDWQLFMQQVFSAHANSAPVLSDILNYLFMVSSVLLQIAFIFVT
jgi:hypothetical protein